MTSSPAPPPKTLHWVGGPQGHLVLIDQTLLPVEFVEIECHDVEAVWEAIRTLRVRGAPAIGIAAAYGVCLGLQTVAGQTEAALFCRLEEVAARLATSRPTAVNLFWALNRMKDAARRAASMPSPSLHGTPRGEGDVGPACRAGPFSAVDSKSRPADGTYRGEGRGEGPAENLINALLAEAHAIAAEDQRVCRAIGRFGADLFVDGQGVLTHCNAGGLATADYGTALAVFFAAQEAGKRLHVYADETRPLLQGARLTAWELKQRGIDVTLICDSMAAQVMREGRVQAVVVGADRIAANGDTANKIGTYGVAVLAAVHEIPFYVAAPRSTFDFAISSGAEIPIEQRDGREVTHGMGRQTAPDGVAVYNPAFDVTPARLIAAFITEQGVIRPPFPETLSARLRETNTMERSGRIP